jgi:hypothetical protein
MYTDKEIADIVTLVKVFNSFNEDNNPWEERDFGSFVYSEQKIFWKIDYYDGQDNLDLVLTIMLSDEY